MGRTAAIILCAGSGSRFGSDKLALMLGSKPLWKWSVDTFVQHTGIDMVVVVTAAEKVEDIRARCAAGQCVVGADTRQGSVLRGLLALPEDVDFVLIHDGARPFVTSKMISDCLVACREYGAVMVGIPVVDTVRQRSEEGVRVLDRDQLVAAQTPQGGRRSDLIAAHQSGISSTDDAGLLEAKGIPVTLVEGDRRNLKVTTREDFEMARSLVESSTETRTGLGYDIHAFSEDPNRPLWLGGVRFEGCPGLEGHSDADALLHAVVDALLGATAMGDIGLLYPPSDAQWKDAPSIRFLRETAERVRAAQWEILHLDATILAEVPKVMPRSQEIRHAIAQAAGISMDRVSIKATTNEKLGAIGRSEGIAAMAVATVRRSVPGEINL